MTGEGAGRVRVAARDAQLLREKRFRNLGNQIRDAADTAERAAGILDDSNLRAVAVALRDAADRADALARA
jgi:hypothetical protein